MQITTVVHYTEDEERACQFLREQLAEVDRQYRRQAQPLIDALAKIEGNARRSVFYHLPAEGCVPPSTIRSHEP